MESSAGMPHARIACMTHEVGRSGDLVRVSDDERDRAAEQVREAFTAGRLTAVELDDRIGAIYQAASRAELEPAIRDLPASGRRAAHLPDRRPTLRFAAGVFGGFVRAGAWTVPPRFTSWSMFGGGRLDLRDAHFVSHETTISAVALWGGTRITVPDDVEVDVRGVGLFGLFGKRAARRAEQGSPVITIRGLALFGVIVTRSGPAGNDTRR
ncbi:DUF1707 domain-containing protein (plasmid) [Streptomyces sp. Q6]|uniref:DUF1707 domain-containing protein n=1 Tax=Streptomyces citrinus TaxID=3118173 RepID=A0ACD5AQ20_9ACTN